MKYHPILFSTPMVMALDRKTQTRRTSPGWGKLKPGDRLWVREQFAKYQTVNYVRRPDGRSFSAFSDGIAAYRADGHDSIADLKDHIRLMSDYSLEAVEVYRDRWLPSIHMPKWACRTILEVEDIRAERLQDITESDARAEGVSSVAEFRELWESLHGLGAWELNPELWVILFRRLGGKELRKALEELKGNG